MAFCCPFPPDSFLVLCYMDLRLFLKPVSLSGLPTCCLPVLVVKPCLPPMQITGQWGHLSLPLTWWAHSVCLRTRTSCDTLILGKSQKHKRSCFNIFFLPPSFFFLSFSSFLSAFLPSFPSCKGKDICTESQALPSGSRPDYTQPSPLPHFHPPG